jgi:DNA-directed RNA polymerase subunit RPC12/RpoP
MMCTCPKCHAKIELDLPEVTEAGTPGACPACSARFNVFRESFGSRALHKTGEISCASCGGELGPQLHCPSCGARFPDVLVVSMGRKRVRKESKKVKLTSSPLPQKQSSASQTSQLPTLEMSMRPEEARPVLPILSRSPRQTMIVSLVLLVVLIAGGSVLFLKYKAEKRYARNFVMATFCLQTGIDKAFKSSARISGEWKQKVDAGQPYTAHASTEDDRDFGILSGKLDAALNNMAQPPKKYSSVSERLAKLQAVYAKGRGLVLTPGNSLQSFSENAAKLDTEYKQAAREFKSGIPPEILKELAAASLKLKGLRTLLR